MYPLVFPLPLTLVLVASLFGLGGCGSLLNSAGEGMGRQLSDSVLNSDDPDTIRQALPAYILTVDALLQDSDSAPLYRSAASLNSSYASQFAATAEQKQRLADKAWRYAQAAACFEEESWCGVATFSFQQLDSLVQASDEDMVPTLYNLGSVWAGWIETHSDDWNAVARLGHVRVLMERIVVLDESYEQGAAHLYLGVLSSLIPPALGGKPEEGKIHFERAIKLSAEKNLMAKVLYAERYARLVFDRNLHDRLLQEVLTADAQQPGFSLANMLAKQKALELQKNADNYF